jgi:hypothetical protein
VEYSSTGELLKQYLGLGLPKIFVYGEENKALSYIPELISKNMNIQSISDSNHFVFYDNPKELYEVISRFINGITEF